METLVCGLSSNAFNSSHQLAKLACVLSPKGRDVTSAVPTRLGPIYTNRWTHGFVIFHGEVWVDCGELCIKDG